MATTVIGVFDDWSHARRVVEELESSGFRRDEISLLANRDRAPQDDVPNINTLESTGSGAQASTGAAVGGLTGFIAGVVALAIPGIGPVLAAGPLAAGIIGASAGAATGGLIGAFQAKGVPEHEVETYSEAVRRGSTVVSVDASDQIHADRAVDVMNRHGAIDVDTRADEWRREGWRIRADRPLDLGADPGRIERVGADQMGRNRGTERGARAFIW